MDTLSDDLWVVGSSLVVEGEHSSFIIALSVSDVTEAIGGRDEGGLPQV